jgi:hypothetical protein
MHGLERVTSALKGSVGSLHHVVGAWAACRAILRFITEAGCCCGVKYMCVNWHSDASLHPAYWWCLTAGVLDRLQPGLRPAGGQIGLCEWCVHMVSQVDQGRSAQKAPC